MYELKPLSAELRLEIDEKQSKVNGTEAKIVFKNSSLIKVVTASDTARGNTFEYNKTSIQKGCPHNKKLL